jgi:hypothetical protein
LADHLVDWLPEIALKASDLASVQHLQLRRKTRDAVNAIKRQRAISDQQLVGETLLHVVIRQSFGSEPIACKLFYQSATGVRSFGSAHIVHAPRGDELWLAAPLSPPPIVMRRFSMPRWRISNTCSIPIS